MAKKKSSKKSHPAPSTAHHSSLSALLDSHGAAEVVKMLADVSRHRASIASTQGDRIIAKSWRRKAVMISKLSTRLRRT